jgi:hypothetical protein
LEEVAFELGLEWHVDLGGGDSGNGILSRRNSEQRGRNSVMV